MKIILGISSGIAAYKIPELAKSLIQAGHDVHVVMTSNASYLVSPNELESITKNPVSIELFNKNFSREKILRERKVDHIELAKNADLIVVAPATANTIASLAYGRADDFLSTTILATRAPVLICPSMNDQMWTHPAVQQNIQKIQTYGYVVMPPESGSLACGTEGIGRLPKIESIKKYVENILELHDNLKGKKILVTSGPTIEYIDDARTISNRSTGKMGISLAEECYKRGAEVLLLRAATSLNSYYPIQQEIFKTTEELETLIQKHIYTVDIVFHTAAVSDFRTEKHVGKIDSTSKTTITLTPREKIINKMKNMNPKIVLVGFKAISGAIQDNMSKINNVLKESRADYIVVNDISRLDIGFESDENEVNIIDKIGNQKKIGKMSKQEIAKQIIDNTI